jgi:hypothetical protein
MILKEEQEEQGRIHYYTVPSKVQMRQPFYFVCESHTFSPENDYILYKINPMGESTLVSTFQPSSFFSSLPVENNITIRTYLTIDNVGNIYASSTQGVYKYNPVVKKFETFISNHVYLPKGMEVDNEQYIYISNVTRETQSPRISVFDPKGQFLYDIFSEWLSSPGDIKKDKLGNLYVINEKPLDLPSNPKGTDYNPNSKYNGSFLLLHIIPKRNNTLSGTVNICSYETLDHPMSLAFDSQNNGYVVGKNRVSMVNMVTGDAYILKDFALKEPRCIAFDKKDNMFVLTVEDASYQIKKLNKMRQLLNYYTTDTCITSLCFDKNENLYMGNTKGEIKKITCNRYIFHVANNMLPKGIHPLIIYDDKNRKTVVSSISLRIDTHDVPPLPVIQSQHRNPVNNSRFNITNITKRNFGYGNIVGTGRRNHTRRH